ncbi:unnamed protein product [Lampetra planeri]
MLACALTTGHVRAPAGPGGRRGGGLRASGAPAARRCVRTQYRRSCPPRLGYASAIGLPTWVLCVLVRACEARSTIRALRGDETREVFSSDATGDRLQQQQQPPPPPPPRATWAPTDNAGDRQSSTPDHRGDALLLERALHCWIGASPHLVAILRLVVVVAMTLGEKGRGQNSVLTKSLTGTRRGLAGDSPSEDRGPTEVSQRCQIRRLPPRR